MTVSEALKIQKRDLQIQKDNKALPDGIEALEIVIKSLEEIQEYKAVGTVEELQDMKNKYQEAVVDWRQYRKIGTIEEFKALKERNVAKKAIGKRKYDEAYCPACNEVISDGEFWALDEYVHHCNYCGQAVKGVDWQ